MTRRWWRSNRLWLLLVPVALVAMVAASSYRVKTYWYDDGLHHAVANAEPGHYVAVDIPYEDTAGRTAYRFRVRLDEVEQVQRIRDRTGEETDVPAGAAAYRFRMSYTADPSVALTLCSLTVVDTRGNQYGNTLGASRLCVPQRHPGPQPALFKGVKRGVVAKGEARPRRWTVAPVWLLARGAVPSEVRLSFAKPDYVSLPVPR